MAQKNQKDTPATNPSLQRVWQGLYDTLSSEYTKTKSMKMIGSLYNVSLQTVMYHLFPDYQERQKKRESKPKQDSYHTRYFAARQNIGKLVKKSYERSDKASMTLDELSETVKEISGIGFRPSTLENLNNEYQFDNGHPLFHRARGRNHYRLSDNMKNS